MGAFGKQWEETVINLLYEQITSSSSIANTISPESNKSVFPCILKNINMNSFKCNPLEPPTSLNEVGSIFNMSVILQLWITDAISANAWLRYLYSTYM